MTAHTIHLTDAQVAFIERKIMSGEYGSAEDVLREGLDALMSKEAWVERWLRDEVVPTAQELEEHPERMLPLEEAFDLIEQELEEERRRRKSA
jgi:putative addiction module CopG family antidote